MEIYKCGECGGYMTGKYKHGKPVLQCQCGVEKDYSSHTVSVVNVGVKK